MGEPPARAGNNPAAAARPLDGEALLGAFAGGTQALARQADAINAINVFPVPDGDTGTNMSLTMRAALEEAGRAEPRAEQDPSRPSVNRFLRAYIIAHRGRG